MTFGFIILRHIRKPEHNRLWQLCYHSIRRFFTNPILIISDNCLPECIEQPSFPLYNTQIIESDPKFAGAAEILPYYYFYHLHPFDKVVIFQDSMYLREFYDFENYPLVDVISLWGFGAYSHFEQMEVYLLSSTPKNTQHVLECYHSKKWDGSNGTCSLVTWDFVRRLENMFGFLDAYIPILQQGRHARCSFERAYGVLCSVLSQSYREKPCLFCGVFDQDCPISKTGYGR